jgi:Stage II sporulation protein E (SpoIIE)/Beta-galactosidase jelly roll domain
MRRVGWALLILLGSVSAGAQANPGGRHPAGASATPPASMPTVTLGLSSAELVGPWKFRTGDNMAWAQTNFDDSNWGSIDLTPPPGSADATLAISGDLPGWTATGYPNYAGYAWYRLRVNVEGATRRLALKMPDQADDAYQVFVNGQEIGSFGNFTEHHVTAYTTLPEDFRLPKGLHDGTITIAIRMWMDSATLFNSPDAGGLHGPPVLGYASIIGALTQLAYDENAHDLVTGFVESMILFMALLLTLSLFWLDREEKAYFWLALVCLVTLLSNTIVQLGSFTAWIGQTPAVILIDVILAPLRIGLWVIFWGYWFRLWRTGRLHWLVWTVVGVLVIGTAMLRPPLYGLHVPTHYASFINPILLIAKLYLGLLLFLVTFRGLRRQKTEGWMAATAVVLVFVANYQHEMRLIHFLRPLTRFTVLGLEISLGTIATVVSLLMITVLLLIRYFNTQKLKEQWKLEIQQAQHVQQILIPNKLPDIPGLTIDSAYRPAREVGGDFFQVLPGDVPGSVLIIVGDVTGKGMQAGMLVATIVGALRGAALHSQDPVQMMHEVNLQLCERQHASATCQILYIDPAGHTTLANAGQLPPYLNGNEMEMEGALPLGTIPDAEHSVTTFVLHPGDSLVLMSDGIVEAQDVHGNLLGFDRIGELLQNTITAEDIATAAQNFGQEDDILVLQVRRNAA